MIDFESGRNKGIPKSETGPASFFEPSSYSPRGRRRSRRGGYRPPLIKSKLTLLDPYY